MTNRLAAPAALKKELASEDPVVIAIAELVSGATLLKAVRNGKPHFRDFSLSKDLKRLLWNSGNKKDAGVEIANITEICHGQKTKTFKDNPVAGYEKMSFSVMYDKRSLDIVCKDTREYEAWTRGLEALIGGFQDLEAVMALHKKHQRDSKLKVGFDAQGQAKIAIHEEPCDVYTWGYGCAGILGHGDEDDEKAPRVLEAVLGRSVRQLALAENHSIALELSGEVYTWGSGQYGRLGHGNLHPRFLPLRVGVPLQGSDAVHVACNTYHSAAVLDDGSVYTWGLTSNPKFGRLGYACSRRTTVPTLVEALKDHFVSMVACGLDHTLVLTESSEVIVFGENAKGQLGCGERQRDTVYTVSFGDRCDLAVLKVAAGAHHSAALTSDGDVYMWGSNSFGQCGAPPATKIVWTPEAIRGIENIEDIACGEGHTILVGLSGAVYSFGVNTDGQLGLGESSKTLPEQHQPTIVHVPGNVKFTKVAAGLRSSAAVTESGRLYTWGCGEHGVLGHSDTKARHAPYEVAALGDKSVRSVSVGSKHMAALTLNSWVADDEAKLCMSCKLKFTAVRRRHHCRQCGGVFCSACTTKRYPLLDKGFSEPVRVCDRCYALLTRKGMLGGNDS